MVLEKIDPHTFEKMNFDPDFALYTKSNPQIYCSPKKIRKYLE